MAQSPPASVEHSLSEKAYHLIRRDIIRCVLEPGSWVREVELAARYGLGRAAVRTALNRLYQANLVKVVPRQGYVVAPITLKNVRDLFEARLLLEPPTVHRAAGNIADAQIEHLDALSHINYRLGDRESAEAFLRANTDFHVVVARASGNERLAGMVAVLLDEMERFFHLGLMRRDRNNEMFHEHHELIEALARHDGALAEAVAAQQIQAAEKMVVDGLLSSPSLQTLNLGGR